MQRGDSSNTPKLPYIGSVKLLPSLANEADGDFQAVVVSAKLCVSNNASIGVIIGH